MKKSSVSYLYRSISSVALLRGCLCCVSAVLKAVSNVNDIIAPALVGKVCGILYEF